MAYRRKKSRGTRGKRCVRRKRVHVRGLGMAWRCAKYSGSRKRKSYRRRKRPFNKGRKCIEKGVDKNGRETCRSYGAVYGGKRKNRRRSRPRFVASPASGTWNRWFPNTTPSWMAI